MQRAHHFILHPNSTDMLLALPLDADALLEVGYVLINHELNRPNRTARRPVPVLSEAVYEHLHTLYEEGGEHTEAALFVLVYDLRARAQNRVLAEEQA